MVRARCRTRGVRGVYACVWCKRMSGSTVELQDVRARWRGGDAAVVLAAHGRRCDGGAAVVRGNARAAVE
jgi:hypothetical protein